MCITSLSNDNPWLIFCFVEILANSIDYAALAGRPALMRADIPVGVDLTLESENPDRDRPDVDNEAALFSDFFGSGDIENCGCI